MKFQINDRVEVSGTYGSVEGFCHSENYSVPLILVRLDNPVWNEESDGSFYIIAVAQTSVNLG